MPVLVGVMNMFFYSSVDWAAIKFNMLQQKGVDLGRDKWQDSY